jgi:mannose-6-phosphate isomerase-like protein (cupin superfamily)
LIKWYPVGPNNDLLDWLVVKRSLAMEDKWAMQLHAHPDFEEYWFVIEGKGQIICGDETYDVEPGDLVITPRGVPHKARGDVTFICCTSKHNVYGQTIGTKMQYLAADKPYRENPKDAPEIGTYQESDMSIHF